MTNEIQNRCQTFALYMLDHFGIFVSFWACLFAFLSALFSVITSTILNNDLRTLMIAQLFIFTTLIFLIYFPIIQIIYENKKLYKKHGAIADLYRNSYTLKGIFILGSTINIVYDCVGFYKDYNTKIFIFRVLSDACMFTIYFFSSCYTRDREPPMYNQMSFNPT